jgi:hypothetical protein
VAGVLAHLAFWDQRIVVLVERLKRGATVPVENPIDVDWINDAAKPTQLALPPRRAATLERRRHKRPSRPWALDGAAA